MIRSTRGRKDLLEVAELRALAERQPELSDAAALQIELMEVLRRIQGRVATASLALPADEIAGRLSSGQPLMTFDRLPIDWNEARLLFRQVTDVLRRHEQIDADAMNHLHEIGRSPDLPDLARNWFDGGRCGAGIDMVDEVLAWSMRPFLMRAAAIIQQDTSFGAWKRGICPVCGGEPDFACITANAERMLICCRCQSRWPTEPFACPFCGENDRHRITSFATPDGTYRVTACQSCRRYLKTLDGRRAGRGAMPAVDLIATLPLDVVVMQRGFSNS